MKLNGKEFDPIHFREKYIKDILSADGDLKKIEKTMFTLPDLKLPKDILNPTNEERVAYEYLARARNFIKNFQKRFNIVIFGSARSEVDSPEYKHIKDLINALAEEFKLGIITGGGPGIMEAGNKAAVETRKARKAAGKQANIKSIGINLELPFEKIDPNNDIVDKRRIHPTFFSRIPDMLDYSNGAYAAPGGIGTLFPEAGFVLQLKQVGQIEQQFPLVMHSMYRKLVDSVFETMYQMRKQEGLRPFISEDDLAKNIVLTDKIHEIVAEYKKAENWWRKNFREPYKQILEMRQS